MKSKAQGAAPHSMGVRQIALLLAGCFLFGCVCALSISVYDRIADSAQPLSGGQTIDFSEYGFRLTVPEGFALADQTTSNRQEGGDALFAGCAFGGGDELYIYCSENAARDRISDYGEQEVVTHYVSGGMDDVRFRSLGGRPFICYSTRIAAQDGTETWYVYETWDSFFQLAFETRMPPAKTLPILLTLDFEL